MLNYLFSGTYDHKDGGEALGFWTFMNNKEKFDKEMQGYIFRDLKNVITEHEISIVKLVFQVYNEKQEREYTRLFDLNRFDEKIITIRFEDDEIAIELRKELSKEEKEDV